VIALAVVAVVVGAFLGGWTLAARARCPHSWTLQLDAGRIWLSCALCGVESAGWNVADKRGA
jgi:hypothetical protein